MFCFVIISIIIVISVLLGLIINYCFEHEDFDNPYIKFQTFKTMYNIAPHSWELYTYYVSYRNNRLYQILDFNIFDYYRYRWFCHHLNKEKQKAAQREHQSVLIECFKKDIEAYEKAYNEDIKERLEKVRKNDV